MHKQLYRPSSKKVVIVDVPEMLFCTVKGKDDLNTSVAFKQAVEALFSLSYLLKFTLKKSDLAIDYTVMPLEGLWWAEDMRTFSAQQKAKWHWQLMIMQPEFITKTQFSDGVQQLMLKKDLPALPKVVFESFNEGLSAKVLHVGPFSTEGSTVQRVHDFIIESGYRPYNKHHEIYLSDIRRAEPKNWRTVIRQPIQLV